MLSAVPLERRLAAEGIGTSLLVTVIVGSGAMAQQLSSDRGVQLLENTIATVLGLGALIVALGPVSGAHLNPVVSLADWLAGRRRGTGLPGREVVAYAVVQTVGGLAGALLANVMFAVPLGFSTTQRDDWRLVLAEVVATGGLVGVILSLARSGRGLLAGPVVAAYIGAAYWFTASTAFANPAVTAGRALSDSFAGIAPGSVPAFVAAQIVGALVGLAVVGRLYPDIGHAAEDIVVPTIPAVEENR